MAAPVLDALAQQVTQTTNVIDSAIVLINGISARIAAAIAQAIANGATAEELAPVQAEVDALNAKTQALAQAVEANT